MRVRVVAVEPVPLVSRYVAAESVAAAAFTAVIVGSAPLQLGLATALIAQKTWTELVALITS